MQNFAPIGVTVVKISENLYSPHIMVAVVIK